MTYELEIIEPRAKRLLEELMSLNLIRFIKKQDVAPALRSEEYALDETVGEAAPSREEIKAGLMASAMEVKAAIKGDIKLRSIYEVLDEIEAEQKSAVAL